MATTSVTPSNAGVSSASSALAAYEPSPGQLKTASTRNVLVSE